MYTRDAGLMMSLITAGAVALVYMFVLSAKLQGRLKPPSPLLPPDKLDAEAEGSDGEATSSSARRFSELNLPTVLGGAVFGASFCLLFALLNPLSQIPAVTLDEAKRQLADGTLVLRLSTVAFTVPLLWKAVRVLWPGRKAAARLGGAVPAPYLHETDHLARDSAQYLVFLAALSTLWILSARDVRTVATAVLAYVFAFFCDDWTIISEYSGVLRGRMLPKHRRRIWASSVLLIGPLLVIAWQEFSGWGLVVWWFVVSPSVAAMVVTGLRHNLEPGAPERQGLNGRGTEPAPEQ